MERVIASYDRDQMALIATRLTNLTTATLTKVASIEDLPLDRGTTLVNGPRSSNSVVLGGRFVQASVSTSLNPNGLAMGLGSPTLGQSPRPRTACSSSPTRSAPSTPPRTRRRPSIEYPIASAFNFGDLAASGSVDGVVILAAASRLPRLRGITPRRQTSSVNRDRTGLGLSTTDSRLDDNDVDAECRLLARMPWNVSRRIPRISILNKPSRHQSADASWGMLAMIYHPSRNQKRCLAIESLEKRLLLSGRRAGQPGVTTPIAITLHLAKASSPEGDFVDVAQSRVILDGQTSPGATVKVLHRIAPGKLMTLAGAIADAQGNFQVKVACGTGTTFLVARATEPSGAVGSASLIVDRANEAIAWNSVALQAVRTAHAQAPDAARDYAIVALSVYDAVDAVRPEYVSYAIAAASTPGASTDAAAASAAYTALVGLFPTQKGTLEAELATSLASIPGGPARTKGVALGASVAGQILALRAADGSSAKVAYDPAPGPDVWTPTPPAYAPPVDPQWGQVKPFALASGSQFQPPAPPDPTSAEFAAEVAQVEAVGGTVSTVRTADQTALAHFWSDLAGTFDPPGHWNQIAEIAAMAHHSNLMESARSLALVDMALADAGIEAWGAKYTYDTARPVTVIRGGLGGINPLVVADPTWTPLWSTPAFPSYISGHSSFSAAAAAVLDATYGTGFAFTDPGDPSLGLAPRHFASFDAAAQEAGISRIDGGIHFESDNLAGLQVGGKVGRFVIAHELRPTGATPR